MVKTKELKRRSKKLAAAALSLCLAAGMAPAAALADEGEQNTNIKDWKTIYSELGVDTTSGYDTVTSATNFESGHAKEDFAAAGIPKSVSRVKNEQGSTTGLDGAFISNDAKKPISLRRARHATFEGASAKKTYGTDEFLIEPQYEGIDDYSWNGYFDSVYAVTVSDGSTTVGAVPWIDYYGQKSSTDKGTSGVGHYNYVEVALNSGTVAADNKADVHRFDSFYENGELKSGYYTVTVYSNIYEPLTAENIWVGKRAGVSVESISDITETSAKIAFSAELPQDYQPVYTVDGKEAKYADGTLSYEALKPGSHTVLITSGNKNANGDEKYQSIKKDFIISTDKEVAAYNPETKMIEMTDQAGNISLEDYVAAIERVYVNGQDCPAAGKNRKEVIKSDGTIDLSATASAGKKVAATMRVVAKGYPELSFTMDGTIDEDTIVSIEDQVYTGKAVKPEVKVAVSGVEYVSNKAKDIDVELEEGKDFETEFSNNIEAGEAKAVIKGIGNYKGSKEVTFKIKQQAADKTQTKKDEDKKTNTAADTKAKSDSQTKAKTDTAAKVKTNKAVKKASQKMTVKAVTKKLKAKKLKKKNQVIKKAVKVKKAVGKVTYTKTGVKKAKFNKYFKVAKKTGNITVRKGLKKGTYKVKIKVTAAGNAKYNAASKNVTVKIKVK